MATYTREKSLDERVAILEDRLAKLERSGSIVDDISLFRTSFENYNFDDSTTATTVYETTFTPRGGLLTLGLLFFGDFVGSSPAVNTGGAWDVLLNGTASASGTVPATFTIVGAQPALDLTPYLGTTDLHVELRTHRTSGASSGGKFGGGGCVGSAVTYARIS